MISIPWCYSATIRVIVSSQTRLMIMTQQKTLLYFTRSLLTCLISAAFLSSCAQKPDKISAEVGYISTKSLDEAASSLGISDLRRQALRDTAATLGTQGGLAWRSEHIDAALTKQATYLDHVFDYNQLMLKNNVVPPVLAETDNSINLDGSNSIRLADKTYQILDQAHFASAPPTWRTYLWLGYKKPSVPNSTLLPRNQREVAYWNTFLQIGWKKGLEQANQIFSANLARMKRDFSGMVLYHKLLDEKMVSAPFVSKANLGVTGDANKLRINDKVLRITDNSKLQTNSGDWQPVLTH
jgi:defect in organelle trafficking protein DotC